MGRRRLACDGKSSSQASWISFRFTATGIRTRLFVGCSLFLYCLSPLGLAADVFYRRIACSAGTFCALQSKRVGSMAQNSSAELEQPGPRNTLPLEIVPLSDPLDDGDEPFLARHARYLPNLPQALLEQDPPPGPADRCDLHGAGDSRSPAARLSIRPLRTPPPGGQRISS